LNVSGNKAAAGNYDNQFEYLEMVESIVGGNPFRRKRVKFEINAKHGYLLPPS
jgi:hypothetical protein